MNRRFSYVAKLSWVDWLGLSLVAIGTFLALSIFWLPNLLGRLLGLGGGWYGGATGIAFGQILIAPGSIVTGVLLLLTVSATLAISFARSSAPARCG
jgi:hypothetical protein